jgi:hypothetical protein
MSLQGPGRIQDKWAGPSALDEYNKLAIKFWSVVGLCVPCVGNVGAGPSDFLPGAMRSTNPSTGLCAETIARSMTSNVLLKSMQWIHASSCRDSDVAKCQRLDSPRELDIARLTLFHQCIYMQLNLFVGVWRR